MDENLNTESSGQQNPPSGASAEKMIALAVIALVAVGVGWQVLKARTPAQPAPATVAAPVPSPEDQVTALQSLSEQAPTPENYLNLSLAYHRARRFEDEIKAAQQALKIRPNYAEAWNNIAAANADLMRWDESIHAAQEAVRLSPDMQLARNNLAYAQAQKAKTQSK